MSTPTQVPAQQAPAVVSVEGSDPFRFGWRYVWRKGEDGLMKQVQVPLTLEDVLHPQEEDFIANNAAHAQDCRYLEHALLIAVNGRENVEVLRDVRVDWGVEAVKAHGPDLAVFADVRQGWKRDAGTFHVRELGARPLLVIEVTSPSTRSTDLDDKVIEYHRAGVPFYAIIDYRPELEQRQVHLLGYRSTAEGYVRVQLNEQGRLWLEAVRLWLAGDGEWAVCFDELGQRIPDSQQLNRDAQKAEVRAQQAESDAQKAEVRAQQAESDAQKARQENADLKARLAELERQQQRPGGGTAAGPPST